MDTDTFTLNVDLDGVVADYQLELRRRVAAERDVPLSDIGPQIHWEPHLCGWGVRDREHFWDIHNAGVNENMFRTMPEIEGASDALWELSDAGYHIRVVTHRLLVNWSHEQVVADTVAWLQEPRPDGRPRVPFRDLCFLGLKADVAGDALIDDAPHNVEAVLDARRRGLPSPQPIVFDAPYNRHLETVRASSWTDVIGLLEQARAWRSSDPLSPTTSS